MRRLRVDKPLALVIGALLVCGVFIFASAVFGLLARGNTHLSSVAFSHLVLGIGLGVFALFACLCIDYRRWRAIAPYLFAIAFVATALVFFPPLGFEHGGAKRWLIIAGVSVQPAEALKVTTILFAASYFSLLKARVHSFLLGFGGVIGILALPGLLLFLQPDVDTFGVIALSVAAIYFAAGAPWRHILLVLCAAILALSFLVLQKEYVRNRIETFFHPEQNAQTQSWQIRQSLIAIGSGGLAGRGFGQGVQKFTYLPEPMGDSIFAVAAEETGFIGSVVIVGLFLALSLRGYRVAAHAPDLFGSLVAVGLSTYLASQAFINIGAMLGVLPLSGIPLTFISQGGSAMLAALTAAGILLSVSRARIRG